MSDAPPGFHAPGAVKTRFTPFGWALLATGVLCGLIPGVQLVGALVVSWVLLALLVSRRSVAGLRLREPGPGTVIAGDVLVLDLEARNDAPFASARDVTVHHPAEHAAGLRPAAFVPELGPGESMRLPARFRSRRRGRHTSCVFVAVSTYPFGLAFTLAEYELPADLLVLPRPQPIPGAAELFGAFGLVESRGARSTSEGEFLGLRAWREGESQRLLHWRASARLGRPVVRELTSEDRTTVHVRLVTGIAHLLPPDGARVTEVERIEQAAERAFDRAVTLAASVVDHFLAAGHPVRLTLTGEETATRAARGRAGLYPPLMLLAEAQGRPVPPCLDVPPVRRAERTIVVVAGRRAADSPTPRAALRARSRGPLVLYTDAPVEEGARRRYRPGRRPVFLAVRS